MPGDVATSPAPAPPSVPSSSQNHHHHGPTTARGLLCHAVAGASAGMCGCFCAGTTLYAFRPVVSFSVSGLWR